MEKLVCSQDNFNSYELYINFLHGDPQKYCLVKHEILIPKMMYGSYDWANDENRVIKKKRLSKRLVNVNKITTADDWYAVGMKYLRWKKRTTG